MRLAGRVARLAERRFAYMILEGKPEVHKLFGELDVEGRIILKRNF